MLVSEQQRVSMSLPEVDADWELIFSFFSACSVVSRFRFSISPVHSEVKEVFVVSADINEL